MNSSEGYPTLEIQGADALKSIKIRYQKKVEFNMEESLKKVFKEECWDLSRIEFENKELKVFLQNENKKIQIIF